MSDCNRDALPKVIGRLFVKHYWMTVLESAILTRRI